MNFAFVKYLLDTIGVGPFLFIRFLTMPVLAFALLAIVFRRHIRRTWPKREDLPRFVACGLIGHALHVAPDRLQGHAELVGQLLHRGGTARAHDFRILARR